MNKKIEEFLLKHNFKINGNEAYGYIKGYEINFYYVPADNVTPVRWHLAFNSSQEAKSKIIEELRKINIKNLKYDADIFGMVFGINDLTVGKLIVRFDEVFETIIDILETNDVKNGGYCPLCGEEFVEESKVYKINGIKHKLHLTCGQEVADAFDEANKEFDEMPNNYLKGTLGAILGALVGCISYVILYYLGFISSLSAVVSIFLGGLLYKKFGGKPNIVMVIITSVIAIGTLMFTVYLLYGLAAIGYTSEAGMMLPFGEAFSMLMEYEEFSSAFYSDLFMTVLFSLIGAGYQAVALSKSLQKKNKIQ